MKAKEVDGKDGIRRIRIDCPGCKMSHVVRVSGQDPWGFNGDFEKPTLTPSLLTRTGHYMSDHSGDCWCDYNAKHPENPAPFKCSVCHCFVTDGRIQFLNDSTHELSGQTVDLPEIESESGNND